MVKFKSTKSWAHEKQSKAISFVCGLWMEWRSNYNIFDIWLAALGQMEINAIYYLPAELFSQQWGIVKLLFCMKLQSVRVASEIHSYARIHSYIGMQLRIHMDEQYVPPCTWERCESQTQHTQSLLRVVCECMCERMYTEVDAIVSLSPSHSHSHFERVCALRRAFRINEMETTKYTKCLNWKKKNRPQKYTCDTIFLFLKKKRI